MKRLYYDGFFEREGGKRGVLFSTFLILTLNLIYLFVRVECESSSES